MSFAAAGLHADTTDLESESSVPSPCLQRMSRNSFPSPLDAVCFLPHSHSLTICTPLIASSAGELSSRRKSHLHSGGVSLSSPRRPIISWVDAPWQSAVIFVREAGGGAEANSTGSRVRSPGVNPAFPWASFLPILVTSSVKQE